VFSAQVFSDVLQGDGELFDQRVLWVLFDDDGDRGRVHRLQLPGAPRTGDREVLLDAGGHRAVAAEAGALADRRPPARAEVDRVHADREGGCGFWIGGECGRPLLQLGIFWD
jgi:hypothetical protein